MKFALTTEDKHSALWKKLMAHWTSKIEALHVGMEGDRTDTETAKLRGQIRELRSNLALHKDPIKE